MKKSGLRQLSISELVYLFIKIVGEQEKMILPSDQSNLNRLVWAMFDVSKELKLRPGDGRHALLPLYDHPNLQVRLQAAKETLALAPVEGRRVLEFLASSPFNPQALDAGMSLINLDRGIFKPE